MREPFAKIAFLCAAFSITGICYGDSYGCQAVDLALLDSRLHLLVQTSVETTPVFRHSAVPKNFKYYQLEIDPRNMETGARILGPLLSQEVGAPRECLGPTPSQVSIGYNFSGDLVKTTNRNGQLHREALDAWAPTPTWRFLLEGTAIALDPFERHRAVTLSGKYIAEPTLAGEGSVHEISSGKRLEDEWLQSTLGRLLQLDIADVSLALADDLNAIVCWPHSGSYRDYRGRTIDTFSVGGKPFARASSFVAAIRDGAGLRGLAKPVARLPDGARDRSFRSLVTIDGKAALVLVTGGKTKVTALSGETLHATEGEFSSLRAHDSAGQRLIFWTPAISKPHIDIWNYAKGTVDRCDVDLSRFFELRGFEMVPKSATPIGNR